MTRRFRPRTAVVCTSDDLKALDRLVRRAEGMVRRPHSDPEAFRRAADQAGRAVLPMAQRRRDGELVQLMDLGRAWGGMSPEAREARVPELAALAKICRASLATDAPPAPLPPPAPRYRADLDG
ncbi:hypothetical protein [Phenylobacterium sp.]|uniref:hypothetical protein n=1 Tax=Phenylobacterium sp. TaxID=1871053 RepID=UPI0035AE78F7